MFGSFEKIHNDFVNHTVPISNLKLKSNVEKYSIFHITDVIKSDKYSIIYQRMSESKIISICQYLAKNNIYFIICFEKTVIIIDSKQISCLKNLFESKPNLTICFQNGVKSNFIDDIKYTESYLEFYDDIICQYLLKPIQIIYKSIVSSILRYSIKKNLIEMSSTNRIKDFQFNNDKSKKYNENCDYIQLNKIGSGYYSQINLIYLFENEKIYAIKKPQLNDEDEVNKHFNREKNNYQKFNHPLLPKYFGVNESTKSIIIEYIYGDTLYNLIKMHKLNESDKIQIIFEIMLIIRYFHDNEMILRDLKPDNIMIDHNKSVVFIDFDNVVSFNGILDNENSTKNFSIMIEKDPLESNINQFNDFGINSTIKNIYEKCINKNPDERLKIHEIIDIYYNGYQSNIKIENFDCTCKEFGVLLNDSQKHLQLGIYYFKIIYSKVFII